MQIIMIVVVIVVAIRESRLLLPFKEKYLGEHLIYVSEEVYTLQNMISFWMGLILIILLNRRDSPKFSNAPEEKTPPRRSLSPIENKLSSPSDKKGKDPWRLVFPDDEKSKKRSQKRKTKKSKGKGETK